MDFFWGVGGAALVLEFIGEDRYRCHIWSEVKQLGSANPLIKQKRCREISGQELISFS